MSNLNRIESNNAELRECIQIAESLPDAVEPSGEIEITENGTYDVAQFASAKVEIEASGGGELPTLFAPTISKAEADTKINITDNENGGFVEKYEVYIGGVKSGEVTAKDFTIADITTSNEKIEIFVKAIASLFNASESSNVVVRAASVEGTVGLEYVLNSSGTSYKIKSLGSATDTDIVMPALYEGLPVTNYEREVFKGNTTITSIVFGKNIVQYVDQTCEGCTSLVRVDFSLNEGGIYLLGYRCFSGCTALKEVIFCASIRTINSYAVFGGSNFELLDMTAYGVDKQFPELQTLPFNNASPNFKIRVAKGAKTILAAMTNWSAYADNIVEV